MSAATRQVRLNYEELLQLKWLLGGFLALISLWTLVYLEVRSGPLIAATALAVLVSLFSPSLLGKIPAVVWKAVTPALIMIVVSDFVLSRPDIVPPLVRMIILLVLVRCLQYRKRREDLQLILLCLFMVVISGVLTLSLTFGLQILVFTPFAMALLFIINLTESYDRQEEMPRNFWSGFNLWAFFMRILRALDFRLLGFAASLFAGVVAVSSLIFVLMPRFRLDQALPFLSLKSQPRSGFTDNISFGDVAEIIEDNSVALRVDLPANIQVPVNPYWRMVVLDEYNNGVFRMSLSAKERNKVYTDNAFTMKNGPDKPRRYRSEENYWTFYLEGGISKFLPLVGPFSELRFQKRRDVVFNDTLHVVSTGSISAGVLFYQIENMREADTAPHPFAYRDERRLSELDTLPVRRQASRIRSKVPYPQSTLVVPDGRRNLEALQKAVDEITGGEELDVREFSRRAVDYLRQRHAYSLSISIPPGREDNLIRWLKSENPGHCELFAGSFTLLARMAGFPTRVVTGFRGGAWSGYENYYMVRNRNAHAWCEVFDGQGAWFRVDPSPGADVTGSGQGGAAAAGSLLVDTSWRAYLDSLRILWYRRIVNFDKEQQAELAGRLKSTGAEFLELAKAFLTERLAAFRQWFSMPWSGGKFLTLAFYFVLSASIYLMVRYAHLWLPKLLSEARFFGLDFSGDPVRKTAGKFVARFRERNTLVNHPQAGDSPPSVEPAEWRQAYRDLLALRFGDSRARPEARPVFRRARRLLKQYERG